jgi:predicted regulator of amino acid metabolism with ACT domain
MSLLNVLEDLESTQATFAEVLGVSRRTVNEIVIVIPQPRESRGDFA